LAIRSGSNTWDVPWADVSAIVFDPKAVLIRRSDGTSGRFKAAKSTVRGIHQLFDELKVSYSQADVSTYGFVTSEPKVQPPDRH
jgi:hypothetical protein